MPQRGLRLEVVSWSGNGQPGVGRQVVAHTSGELGMRVQPRPCGRSTERNLTETRHRILDPGDPLPDLCCIAGELLAERHRNGIHEVRSS